MRTAMIGLIGTLLLPSVAVAQGSFGFFREARIGLGSLSIQSEVDGDAATRSSGRFTGVDAYVRLAMLGIRVRSLSGDLSGPGATNGNGHVMREAAVLLGRRRFALEVGVLQRSASPAASEPRVDLRRGGVRSQWNIGSSAVQVSIAGALLFTGDPGFTVSGLKRVGHDSEVEVLVQPTYRVPGFIKLGYRYERLTDPLGATEQVEGRDGVYLVVGVRYARNVGN